MEDLLPYHKLETIFHRTYLNYYTLLYANVLLVEHLNPYEDLCKVPNNFTISNTEGEINPENLFFLHNDDVTKSIKDFGVSVGIDYFPAIKEIMNFNAHFLKTRVINVYYEIIVYYLKIRGKDELNTYFHKFDWFQVLHVLRNFTTHADGLNYSNKFPAENNRKKIPPYPNTIEWGAIKITNGQTEPIIYSDKDVLSLLRYIGAFFLENTMFQ